MAEVPKCRRVRLDGTRQRLQFVSRLCRQKKLPQIFSVEAVPREECAGGVWGTPQLRTKAVFIFLGLLRWKSRGTLRIAGDECINQRTSANGRS